MSIVQDALDAELIRQRAAGAPDHGGAGGAVLLTIGRAPHFEVDHTMQPRTR